MESPTHLSFTAAGLAVALVALVYLRSVVNWRSRTRGRPLPPGPRSLPIVGNIFQAPHSKPWVGYRELCATYGDILHMEILGRHYVVLGSADVIMEYLDKRSANTSDRIRTPLLDLVGANINFAFFPYGQWWRRHRRTFWQYFNPTISPKYRPIQRETAHKFLYRLLSDSSQYVKHIRYTFSAAIVKVIYNNESEQAVENQMTWVDISQEGISQGLPPGKFLVEFLPFLRHLPSYFLGAELRKYSPRWRHAANLLKEARNSTAAHDSVVGNLFRKLAELSNEAQYDEEVAVVKNCAAVALEGGSDTMFSSLQTTFLAMSLNPEILRKAQAQLDSVVGPNRLPDWEDMDALPYITAIVKESLRWQNVLPLSVPHCTVEDDEVHGYFIPAGTVLVPNTWACMHDPEAYDEPDAYRPERFLKDGKLDPTVRDPSKFVFGYGRRNCPGRHYAEAALFINTASVLHVFDILPPLDQDGKPIRIEPRMTDGLVTYPEDCRCKIKPRSEQAEKLIKEAREDMAVAEA
ncbi:cytochrome P450 [Earliella scabrosa]|nr:cytochrome P450 [Earliella scabrosa]